MALAAEEQMMGNLVGSKKKYFIYISYHYVAEGRKHQKLLHKSCLIEVKALIEYGPYLGFEAQT